MNWQFSNSAPIYTQLIGQIRAGIVSGALAPGERLPPVRDLAMEAGVNPNTMAARPDRAGAGWAGIQSAHLRALRHGGSGRDFRCAARAGGGKGADIFIGYDRAGL